MTMEYTTILERIKEQYQDILRDELIGIYVHGSIAFGCFNPKKSDIDFLVVIKQTLSLEAKKRMIQVLMELSKYAPAKGLEMSVVRLEVCKNFCYPTPFELHFSNMHLQSCEENLEEYCKRMNGYDIDLAGHFMVTKSVGYTIFGLPIDEVFGEIPKEAYLDSIKNDIDHAVEDIVEEPVYVILNLCRVLAYISEPKVLSKEQGGDWGIQHLPEIYTKIVKHALNEYRSEDTTYEEAFKEKDKLKEFASYMHRCIFKTEY